MGAQFLSLLQIVAPIFAVMGAGYGARKVGVLSAEADRSLIQLVVYLLSPCLALDTIVGNEALQKAENWILPPLLGFASVAIGVVVSRVFVPLVRFGDERKRRTFVFTNSIQNYGYIPLPLCQALFGKETMGVLFAFSLGVEVAFWSISLRQLTKSQGGAKWRDFVNPPIVAITSAMVLNALGAANWLPVAAHTTFHLLGVCAVPLALILSGGLIADTVNVAVFRTGGGTVLGSLVLRNALLPTLLMTGALLLPVDKALRDVLILQAAMPAAIFPIILTKMNDGDLPTALRVVLGSSLAGLVTIPLWLSFALR